MGMTKLLLFVAVVATFLTGVSSALGRNDTRSDLCSKTVALKNGTERTFQTCKSLSRLNAVLAWTYTPPPRTTSGRATGGKLDLAFTSPVSSGGWIGWGYNPTTSASMVGSNVLVAYKESSTGVDRVNQYYLDSSTARGTPPAPSSSNLTDLNVLQSSALVGTDSATIFAVLQLKEGQTNLNHIWNQGPSVSSGRPSAHVAGDTYLSYGIIDVESGTVVNPGNEEIRKQNRHAIINGIAWGVLFPLGVMIARYMRLFNLFDPAWFYSHIVCQICAYILGVTGWILGLMLISANGVHHHKHRTIGISLFVISTVQLFALVLRPKPSHKLRKFWNMYHYAVGYTVIILSIVNIFEGFKLLKVAQQGWKYAYIGFLIAMAAIAVLLETLTWVAWYRRKLGNAAQPKDNLTSDHMACEAGNGHGFHEDGMGHKAEVQAV